MAEEEKPVTAGIAVGAKLQIALDAQRTLIFETFVDRDASQQSIGEIIHKLLNVADSAEDKYAARQLREEERRSRTILSDMEAGVARLDASGGRLSPRTQGDREKALLNIEKQRQIVRDIQERIAELSGKNARGGQCL